MRSSYKRSRGESPTTSTCLQFVQHPQDYFASHVSYEDAQAVWGNYVLQGVWNAAYQENEAEETAIEITDELVPLLSSYHLEDKEPPDIQLAEEHIRFIEDHDMDTHGQHIRTTSERYNDFLDELQRAESEPEIVVGIHSGGIMPMAVAAEFFDSAYALVNYCPETEDAYTLPHMRERLQGFDHALIAEDFIETGDTRTAVTNYLSDLGVDRKDFIALYSLHNDVDELQLITGGSTL